MYDCWDIDEEKAEKLYLAGMLDERLNFDDPVSYSLEASRIE